MSLETDVANLVTKTTDLITYFNGKKAGIDAAVSAAVAAAPSISRAFFVDSQLGSDDNLGTSASPFKTLEAAIKAVPAGGRADVTLQRDYTLSAHVVLSGRKLVVRGEPGAGRKLILNEFQVDNDGTVNRRMGSFWQGGESAVELVSLTLSLPATTPGDNTAYYALSFGSGSSAPAVNQLRLYNLTFELRGAFLGTLMGPGSVLFQLALVGTSLPASLNGRLIPGIAAGTESKTLSHVITNLATL
ncbi:hypothetical protein [Pseudomonas sp. GZD-222]|jgi:hypothetical protein|uniref:hypothetical protein n=1 Tax=Pseudomonas sp. GZD-222 TaxID=3404805 RepID=UPI002BDFA8CB|nr:hypothetical protein [Pseudomonas sp.]